MFYRKTISALVAILAVTTLALPAVGSVGNGFTYQGRLTDSGSPANGNYDLRFRLFDAATLGAQVGPTVTISNHPVSDGLFTVNLDFGPSAFDGQARWIEIGVRLAPGGGNFTLMNPRQAITPAPYALYAKNSAGSGHWTANGNAIRNVNTGFVGINRDDPVTSAEYFGVQALNLGGYGGMYVRTDGADALPFYGYSTGEERAWTYLDGNTGVLKFNVSGDHMAIAPDGNVGIGTDEPGASLDVINSGGRSAIRASSPWLGVHGIKTGSGTFPGVFGETSSASSGASGVRGFVTNTSPGSDSAGVWGNNAGTSFNGAGVRGTHAGSGQGVVGSSEGGSGVLGYSNNALGYGGVFGQLSAPGKAILAIGESHLLGAVSIGTTAIPTGTTLNVAGKARVEVLEVAGADVAERFPTVESVKPGQVVEIDPQHPGKLRLSRSGYSPRVAGIVSGANGLNAGTILGNYEGNMDSPAIALAGRVWVYCDADANGAIVPGDRLTTAELPGHAMRVVDEDRAPGAVIGKAMTGLESGTGLVLVLVSLQ